jgi:hypothetical protein
MFSQKLMKETGEPNLILQNPRRRLEDERKPMFLPTQDPFKFSFQRKHHMRET